MGWPAVEFETLEWRSAGERGFGRATRKVPRSYEAAVAPRIADLPVDLGTRSLVEKATIAAARFDATVASRIAPYAPLMLRSESVASSRIEQLTSSARKVLEAEATGRGSGNAALIVANTRLMRAAVHSGEATADGIVAMHRVLMEESAAGIAGVLRQEQVWVGGSDFHPGGALFVPPHHRHIEGLLGTWRSLWAVAMRRSLFRQRLHMCNLRRSTRSRTVTDEQVAHSCTSFFVSEV